MKKQDKLYGIIEKSRNLINSMPGLILIKDIDSIYLECNSDFATMIKINKENIIGNTDYHLPWAQFAKIYQGYDKEALEGGELTSLVPLLIADGSILTSRTYKKSILDDDGNAIGVLGQANILVDNVLSKSLYLAHNHDKKETALSGYTPQSYRLGSYPTKISLTQRESECLFLLVRGKTSKEIAKFLSISYRTVESHLEKIKHKFNSSCKSDMVAKAIEMGLMDIIPKGEILRSLYSNPEVWRELFDR